MRSISSQTATIGLMKAKIALRTVRTWISVVSVFYQALLLLARLAFCGRTGQLKFEFPFLEFLPKIQHIGFSAHVSLAWGQVDCHSL